MQLNKYLIIILLVLSLSTERSDKPMDFTIVHISDIHHSYMLNADNFNLMADWIVNNKDVLNIKAVVMSGDIGDERSAGGLASSMQSAKTILDKINNAGIPLLVGIGNHDYDNLTNSRDTTLFNTYFGSDMYSTKEWYGCSFENKSENTYITFNNKGDNYLIMSLEFGTRDKVLNWANQIIASYPNHKVILVTHAYLDKTGLRIQGNQTGSPKNYSGVSTVLGDDYTNDGEEIWNKLVKLHPNIISIHSSHFTNEPTMAYQISKGVNGNTIYEFFNNWQNIVFDENGSGYIYDYTNGTDRASLIRLFTYSDNNVSIANYVPSLGIEGETSIPLNYSYPFKILSEFKNIFTVTENGKENIYSIFLRDGIKEQISKVLCVSNY